MLKSKFLDIIKSFSKEELKEFKDFLNSPFHNTNKNVIKIYEIVRKTTPDFNSASVSKENLFRKIYPGKKYNDTVMRILLSDLLNLGEEFLTIKASRKSKLGELITLLDELKLRGLDSLYRTNYKSAVNALEHMSDARTKYFNKFELEVINVDFYLRRDKQQQITGNVLERAESIIYFSLIELVRNVHDLIINERTFNAKFDFNPVYEFFNSFDFGNMIQKLKDNRSEHYPILFIYYNLFMTLMNEEDENYYDILKRSVMDYVETLNKEETYRLINLVESCCLNRMKYNTLKYRNEIFELYELMLSLGRYSNTDNDDMTAQRYKNILIAAINLNKHEWVEEFTVKYIEKITPEYRESMQAYSYALINFARKDFIRSLENINKVKYDYFILKMDIKSWTLKIFYELAYFEQAISLMDSYRHFLSKNKSLSEHFKERHLNFLKYTGDLMKLASSRNEALLLKLKNDLNGTVNIVHRDWLLEKAGKIQF